MTRPPCETADWDVVHRAFRIAAEGGELCRPIHLLAALAETPGAISAALAVPGGGRLLDRPADPPPVDGGGAGYLVMQTQQAATQLASARAESLGPQHLFLAVIDQREPEVVDALYRAGVDLGDLRRAALGILGASEDLPQIAMPPLTPAGTLDRPALGVEQLDVGAWSVLRWRQEHLPLSRVRRPGDWDALSSIESQAAWRLADRVGVDDDQRYSLMVHHRREVERLAHEAKPAVVETRQKFMERYRYQGPFVHAPGPRWQSFVPNFMVGWPTWFRNRRVGLRDKRFWLLTRRAYRGQPAPRHIDP